MGELYKYGIVPDGMSLKVYHSVHPNLFEIAENVYNLVGVSALKDLFLKEGYKDSGSVTWYYPERFLNWTQQYQLLGRAFNAGFTDITIVTQSPAIAGCVRRENLIVCNAEGNHLLPNDKELRVLGGKINRVVIEDRELTGMCVEQEDGSYFCSQKS